MAGLAVKMLACVASVTVRFRSNERGTIVKDRSKMALVKERGGGGEERKETSPSPHFHCLALVSFLARPKPRIPFLGLSLLRNQTETLATQAIKMSVSITVIKSALFTAKKFFKAKFYFLSAKLCKLLPH